MCTKTRTVWTSRIHRRGYARYPWNDPPCHLLVARQSPERTFECFMALLGHLPSTVDVVLETSHGRTDGHHTDLLREDIDRVVLVSTLCGFESLLMRDRHTGVAVYSVPKMLEVRLLEGKMLHIFAKDSAPFEKTLRAHGLPRAHSLNALRDRQCISPSDDRPHAFRRLAQSLNAQ